MATTSTISKPTTPFRLSSPSIRKISSAHFHPPNNLLFRSQSQWVGRSRLLKSKLRYSVRRFSVSCEVTVINESEFSEKVIGSQVPVLVEFVANWCGPCRLISPVVEWASEEYKDKLKIVKIDHDANPKLIEKYQVYGLPTLILFKNGKEIPHSRREGAVTKVKLKEYLDSLLDSVAAN